MLTRCTIVILHRAPLIKTHAPNHEPIMFSTIWKPTRCNTIREEELARPRSRLSSLLHLILVVEAPLELGTHRLLQVQHLFLLVGQRSVHGMQVPHHLTKASRLKRGGMIGALPCAVLGEVALNPLGTQGVSTNVDRDAEVVAGETNGLHSMLVLLLQEADVKEADILEGHRVARGAIVEHHSLLGIALALFPELHDLLYLLLGGHPGGDVDLA